MILHRDALVKRNSKLKLLTPSGVSSTLLGSGYFPEANIFPPILEVAINSTGRTSHNVSTPITLFVPKTNQQWRDFKLINPGNFVYCSEIIVDNLDKLKQLYCRTTSLISYSVPFSFDTQQYRTGYQISEWHLLQEQLLAVSSKYRLTTVLTFDIQSCYHILYTHALEWALDSIGEKDLGEKLDMSIRRGNENRTHGLPVGPYISDMLSEIVLSWVDYKIEQELKNQMCAGYRFRDNYYFLCPNRAYAETILAKAARELRSAHFTIGNEKTLITSFIDYYSSRWQAEFDLLLATIQYKTEGYIFTNRNLKVFIEQSVLISHRYKNEKSILDKAASYITNSSLGSDVNFRWLFYSIANMLPLRSLSYPKLLVFMKKVALEKGGELVNIFHDFMDSEIDRASKIGDNFALIWLAYILYDTHQADLLEKVKVELSSKTPNDLFIAELLKYLDDDDSLPILWPSNKSKLQLKHKAYLPAQDLNEYLGINFSES